MGVTCPLNDHQVACDAVRARVLTAVPSDAAVGAGCVLQATALGSPESPIGAALRVPACVRASPFPYTAAAAPQGAVGVVRGGLPSLSDRTVPLLGGAALRVPACVRACPSPYTATAALQGVAGVVRGGVPSLSDRTAPGPGLHVPAPVFVTRVLASAVCPPRQVVGSHCVATFAGHGSGPVPVCAMTSVVREPLYSKVAVGKPLYLRPAAEVDPAACVLGHRSLSSPSRPKSVLVAVSVPPRKPLASPTVRVKVCEGALSTAWPVPLVSPAALAAAAAAAAVTATAAAAAAMPVSSTALVLTASASASASAAAAAAAAVAATPASGAGAAAAATAAVAIAATPASCAGAELTSFVVISPPRPCSLLECVRMLPTLTQGYSKSAVRWRAPALPGPRLPHWLAC